MSERHGKGQEMEALHYPLRFHSEHLIKAVAKLTGRTEEKTRQNLADLYEANDKVVFATLLDFLAASFLGH